LEFQTSSTMMVQVNFPTKNCPLLNYGRLAGCTTWKCCTKACIKQSWNGIRFPAWLWNHDVLWIVLYILQIVPYLSNAFLRGKADNCVAPCCIWTYWRLVLIFLCRVMQSSDHGHEACKAISQSRKRGNSVDVSSVHSTDCHLQRPWTRKKRELALTAISSIATSVNCNQEMRELASTSPWTGQLQSRNEGISVCQCLQRPWELASVNVSSVLLGIVKETSNQENKGISVNASSIPWLVEENEGISANVYSILTPVSIAPATFILGNK
jgi:hypothetical protein